MKALIPEEAPREGRPRGSGGKEGHGGQVGQVVVTVRVSRHGRTVRAVHTVRAGRAGSTVYSVAVGSATPICRSRRGRRLTLWRKG